MNRLSEQLVEFKSKCSDYRNVVKLNVWGSNLDDIKICLEMPRLEILALSVNNINTLSSLQNCHRLKELYIRKNKIASFEELNYLTNARSLTSLWLEDNPCVLEAGGTYRARVLRKLPQLKVLDNVEVSEQEVQAALRHEPEPEQKIAISAPVVESAPSTSGAKMNPCRERLEREREKEREEERQEERQRVMKLELKRERKLMEERQRLKELEQKEERKRMRERELMEERERLSTTRRLVQPVRQDASDAMASPFRSDDFDMVDNSFHPRNGGGAAPQRRLPMNDNLLSASLLLIREMDASSLKTLVHAIHQQMSTMSHPN
ncbi:RNA-binding protein 25 [Drosophila gunungcola]|uniref:Uncharacterized protein n=1 Tax=Drosophila gunungcola TaxID=103775 RepID=A0A9P9YDZ3_9MUSC|nr:RNA-binding protein 25 [Drosophila gunungcola]KAI8035146.1 hypothetical protein M5D96_012091 [Drosophila gunungcola]